MRLIFCLLLLGILHGEEQAVMSLTFIDGSTMQLPIVKKEVQAPTGEVQEKEFVRVTCEDGRTAEVEKRHAQNGMDKKALLRLAHITADIADGKIKPMAPMTSERRQELTMRNALGVMAVCKKQIAEFQVKIDDAEKNLARKDLEDGQRQWFTDLRKSLYERQAKAQQSFDSNKQNYLQLGGTLPQEYQE